MQLLQEAVDAWGKLIDENESLTGSDVTDWLVDFVHRARAHLAAPRPPIIVEVEGGLVQAVIQVPPGVTVEVRDFDCEGCDEPEAVYEEEGRRRHYHAWQQTADTEVGQ